MNNCAPSADPQPQVLGLFIPVFSLLSVSVEEAKTQGSLGFCSWIGCGLMVPYHSVPILNL